MKLVHPTPLTREAFAPFGDVVDPDNAIEAFAINSGTCRKFRSIVRMDYAEADGEAAVHLYRVMPLPVPIRISEMERHNLGSQTFIPIGRSPYLVVVAPPGNFDPAKIRVFSATAAQGVHYRRGTWHHFCLALDQESEFLVIDREGLQDDCDIAILPAEDQFIIDQASLDK